MRMKKIFAIICLCCGLSMTAAAQCGIENTAFKSGELLSYDLYFNWKFIWMKVGSAEMDTRLSKFCPIVIRISHRSISARVPVKVADTMWMRYGTVIRVVTAN